MNHRAIFLLSSCYICCFLIGGSEGNNPPFVSFGPSSGYVTFPEDTAIGTSLFAISASDDDSPDVFIEIDTDNTETTELVELSSVSQPGPDLWTVDVLLKKALDRDRSTSVRVLVFKVHDGQSDEILGAVRLFITDVNDNPPLFVHLPYRISLKETAAVGQIVFTLTASDPDDGLGGAVEYSMAAQSQIADGTNNTFVIDNKNLGTIVLQHPLDYETQIYHQYQVYSKDLGSPPCPGPGCKCTNVTEPNLVCEGEATTFTVTVLDVQDTPPFFERLPYFTSVREDASVGSSLFRVLALDGDRGVPNDITYSIVSDGSIFPFAIDSMTGVITVAPPGLDADRPDGQSYTITVMAREETSPEEEQLGETSTETKVSITVLDVNDNAPEFSSATYTATAQENTPRGVPLTLDSTIEVSDKDQTDKSQFMLSVEKDGLPYSVFDTSPPAGVIIQGSTTVIIRVFDASALDFEKTKSITFQLVARENNTADTFIGSTTVTVFLEDANDNSPVFDLTLQPSDVTVTEHEALGTVLATFTATDADSGDYGSVSYSLEDDMDGKFAMDPITGDLSVAADLDREAPGGISHHLVVLATDNMAGEEANRRSTRLNVEVKVQDINDNAPQFHPHPPSVTVQESASSNTVLMTLTATDRDEGDNGRVAYRIVRITSSPISPFDTPYLFAIDAATGVVSVGTSLIGHSGTHVITFEASDSASEPRRATTEVTVHVLDVNVHAPVFTNPDEKLFILTQNKIPEVTVMEEQPPGSLVLQVNAVDEDIKENGRVYYYIVPELTKDWQNFRIDRVNGTLTNQYRLDREEREYFQIRLRAEDNGSPNRLSKEIPLRVNVIGIDDNSPVFPVRRLHVAVGESLENARVGSVDIATDADSDAGNRVRCYYLYGGEILTSFSLQKLDGELFLQNPLNRTVTPEIHLIVKVTRNCSLPENHFYLGNNHSFNATDTSLLEVYVEVQDINDNPPVFKEDALTVGMLDNVEIGTSVFELHDYTTDEDTEMNSQNKFRLLKTGLSGDMPEDLLTPPPFVVKSNGSVLTNRRFRANLLGFFVLTVEAFDDDNQTDTGDLRIYLVSDIQRVKLVFAKQPDEVRGIMGELVRKLSAALGYDVIADRIATHITADGRPDVKMTDVFIHARFRPSQEIVPTSKLERAFDYNEVVWSVFQEFGVRYALPALRPEQEEDSDLLRAFIIVSVFLVVLCLLLVVILVSIIRRCRRKLLAATSAAYAQEKPTLDAYVPPGTNKYLAASNPLFEGKKHPDVDRLSAESLDVNVVDTTRSVSDQDSKPADDEEEQEMYLQLFDESPEPAGHFSKLAMVLNEYDRKLSGQPGDSASTSSTLSVGAAGIRDTREKSGHVTWDSGFNDQNSFERVRVRITEH